MERNLQGKFFTASLAYCKRDVCSPPLSACFKFPGLFFFLFAMYSQREYIITFFLQLQDRLDILQPLRRPISHQLSRHLLALRRLLKLYCSSAFGGGSPNRKRGKGCVCVCVFLCVSPCVRAVCEQKGEWPLTREGKKEKKEAKSC